MFKMTFENFQEFVELTYEGVRNQLVLRSEIKKLYEFLQKNDDYEIYLAQNKMKDFSFALKKQGSDEIFGTLHIRPDRFVFFNGREENNHEKIQVQTLESGMTERKYEYVQPISSEELSEGKPELVDETVEESNLTHTVQSHEIYNRFGIIVYQKANNLIVNEDNSSTLSAKTFTSVVDSGCLDASIKTDVCGFIKSEDQLTGEIDYYTREQREYITKPAAKMNSTEPCTHSTIDILQNTLAITKPESDKNTKHYAESQIQNAAKIHGSAIQSE
ncbi:MAG: hypothetical protein IJW24_01745 [Clostridia bacterium]|nr:hypothetical protein [Clostridia bacterium]